MSFDKGASKGVIECWGRTTQLCKRWVQVQCHASRGIAGNKTFVPDGKMDEMCGGDVRYLLYHRTPPHYGQWFRPHTSKNDGKGPIEWVWQQHSSTTRRDNGTMFRRRLRAPHQQRHLGNVFEQTWEVLKIKLKLLQGCKRIKWGAM